MKLSGKIFCFLWAAGLLLLRPGYGKIDPALFTEMKARSIGPANMSGRIGDIAGVIHNPNIIYVGASTGGVWKSVDGGIKWEPIFDDQPASSIGAVAVFQENPSIVWVGTGEGNPRNSSGVGRGVFKSLDAGKTWTCMGLTKTEKIARIVLDPGNPQIAYVAALGTTWGENPERGVFKTTDGGSTWTKTLYVDEKTGAADLAIAPDNPNKLIAAMWEHRRWPWFFKSGGPGSGLYITNDAGKNWKKLTDKEGLPAGELGRIGIAFAPSRPEIVYALVEAGKSALLRSEDGGFTFQTVHNKPGFDGRPFYYSDIRVNPKNENLIYSLQSSLEMSGDGGKTFGNLANWNQSHSDYQAMWLHPNGDHLIVGSDGGIVISQDRGKTWRFARNLPLGQFYHVSYDMAFPYNVYGGLQDNGSWRGPSAVLNDRGIFYHHWIIVGSGDGFDTEPDPTNPDGCYAMWQGGNLFYTDIKTGEEKDIKPTESDVKHRYNWNAGFAVDPFDPKTIYYGSQFIHRSRDKGQTWEIISPDLTTNDPAKQKQAESGGLTPDVTTAENHTTILSIAPSPVKPGIIWASTDDGNVQLTQDNGKTWTLVSGPLTGPKGRVPAGTWSPHVEASKFDPAEAFAVFDDHRRSNWTTYVFITQDSGKTWKSLVTPDIDGFTHVIEQDPVNRNLLFLGTEFGLFISFDLGKNWQKWTAGVPTVPVHDLAVHPREHELIIGTHGRAIYILDNIAYLREISQSLAQKEVHLFQVPDALMMVRGTTSPYMTMGDGEFSGRNKNYQAQFTFLYNPKAEAKEKKPAKPVGDKNQAKPSEEKKLKLEILNDKGELVKELKVEPKKGINRVYWDFQEKAVELPKEIEDMLWLPGMRVLPGAYAVRLQYGDSKIEQKFQVAFDPRITVNPEVLKKNSDRAREIKGWLLTLISAAKEMYQAKEVIKTVTQLAADLKPEKKDPLLAKAKELGDKVKAAMGRLVPDMEQQGIFDEEEGLGNRIAMINFNVLDAYEPLTQAMEVRIQKTGKDIAVFLEDYNRLFETAVADFYKAAQESGIQLFKPFSPLSLVSATGEKK